MQLRRDSAFQTANYRPDVDGLRAISILAVVAYHAFPTVVTGGFVGVDVFFVISGFLITKIILEQQASTGFSISSFYGRRVQRLFPALITVLGATYAVGWLVLLPADFKQLAENIVAGAGFYSNFLQLRGSGYFAPDVLSNPLLHLWSLGIEEQFYIVWPLVLVALRKRQFLIVTAAIATLSMGLNLYLVQTDRTPAAFYFPISRAWELLLGALIARTTKPRSIVRNGSVQTLISSAGVFLLVLAVVMLDKAIKYPGWWALLPVSGTIFILVSNGSILNRKIFSDPRVVWLGLISYPLYLWHWPLLAYLRILRNDNPTEIEVLLTIILSVGLAWATYRLIELPIRQMKDATRYLAIGMTSVGMMGIATILEDGFEFRFPRQVQEIAALPSKLPSEANAGFRHGCFIDINDSTSTARDHCSESGNGPLILIWGDSTAAALYPGFKNAQTIRTLRVAQFTASGCAPIMANDLQIRSKCDEVNDQTFKIVNVLLPDVVFLHAMWNETTSFEGFHKTIIRLKNIGIGRIVVLGPVPLWKRGLPFNLVNAYRLLHTLPERLKIGVVGSESDELMKSFSEREGVEFISAWRTFCNSEGCIARVGPSADDVTTWDKIHLSTKGSEFLVRAIIDNLLLPNKQR